MKEKATAISPSRIEMWKARYCTMTMPMVMGISPATSHELGTSMASIAALWTARSDFLKTANARAKVRHCSATLVRLEKTMMEVPPQSAQRVGLKLPSVLRVNERTNPGVTAWDRSIKSKCG